MNDKSELNLIQRNKILEEIRGKYMFYQDLIKRNRIDMEHHKYCNQDSHRLCGSIWGHSDLMFEIIGRIWWWFTGSQPYFVKVSTKPRIESVLEMIRKNRKMYDWEENEITDEEHFWLINTIEQCKRFMGSSNEAKKGRKRK